MRISAVVVCAGGANRFGEDKMFLPLGGSTVCQCAVEALALHPAVTQVIVVASADKIEVYRSLFPAYDVVAGGETRHDSVARALSEVREAHVLVHDGARPALSRDLLDRVVDALTEHDAVVPTLPVTDSVMGADGYLDRAALRAVQTPQGFDTALLRKAFAEGGNTYTDEGSLVAAYAPIFEVAGDPDDRKITYPVDYYGVGGETLHGVGYDIHRLVEGRRLVLSGVEIPYDKGLLGHSDADCCLHALMDAALSAVGLPDIGHYFPNTPQWKDADSARLLGIVREELSKVDACVTAVSIAIVAEEPRLSPYLAAMRRRVADLLDLPETSVGISVTTNEKVPMIEGEQAIAATAIATVRRK